MAIAINNILFYLELNSIRFCYNSVRNNSHIHPISSNLMELQAIKSLTAFQAILDLGCRYISSAKQETSGTVSFLTPKGITTIHKNGTIRRSWTYCYMSIDICQAPIIRNLPMETEADWTNALNRVAHQVSYDGPGAAATYPLETMELLFKFAREGKNLKGKFNAKTKKLSVDYSAVNYWELADFKLVRSQEDDATKDLQQRRRDAPGLAAYFLDQQRRQAAWSEAYHEKLAASKVA